MGGHLNILSKIIYDLNMKVSAKIVPKILADCVSLHRRRSGLLV
jgi:hypothetical protein